MITHHTVLDLFRTDFICPFHFNCSISSYWNPVWKFSSQNYSYHKKEDILFGRCAMVDWMFVTFPQSFLLPREKPKALHEYLSTHFIFLSKLYHLSKSELIFVQWYKYNLLLNKKLPSYSTTVWVFRARGGKKRETRQRKLQLQRTISIY